MIPSKQPLRRQRLYSFCERVHQPEHLRVKSFVMHYQFKSMNRKIDRGRGLGALNSVCGDCARNPAIAPGRLANFQHKRIDVVPGFNQPEMRLNLQRTVRINHSDVVRRKTLVFG